MKTRIALAVCLLLVLFPIVSCGEVWNLANDFSATQNPNGAWSYGWRGTPDQPLVLYTDHIYNCYGGPPDFDQWAYNIYSWCPHVIHNPHDYPIGCDTWNLNPHKVMFHPGPAQQSVVRWTAPSDQDLALAVHFETVDTGSSIVYVYRNGTQLFSATLDHLGQLADYATAITIHAGDVIDCAISPISFYADATELDVVLTTSGPTPVAERTWGQVKSLYR